MVFKSICAIKLDIKAPSIPRIGIKKKFSRTLHKIEYETAFALIFCLFPLVKIIPGTTPIYLKKIINIIYSIYSPRIR